MEIQSLPWARQITDSLKNRTPLGGRPTRPALQGAIEHAISYMTARRDRKAVVVLVTGGAPNDCDSDVGNVAEAAAVGFAKQPKIFTHVIGIGNTGNLDPIAQAGGTRKATIITPGNASQQLLDALTRIRKYAQACEIDIPPGIDETKVNVRIVLGGVPAADLLYNVADKAACDAVPEGWYYDHHPSRIVLCPAICDRLFEAQGEINGELGCATLKR